MEFTPQEVEYLADACYAYIKATYPAIEDRWQGKVAWNMRDKLERNEPLSIEEKANLLVFVDVYLAEGLLDSDAEAEVLALKEKLAASILP
jgi:hypothetical protein